MKLIFHTPPVPASLDIPLPRAQNATGRVTGYVTFRVYLCEPDEELPPGRSAGRPTVPESVLAGLPDDALLRFASGFGAENPSSRDAPRR
ncbi:MAG TPA: hypothetical protein VKF59_22465 [Candidatus Dormibacteraeota bacterium]|nr:hypothetical protein [Candidatus Dormibacteraeota bacterium]